MATPDTQARLKAEAEQAQARMRAERGSKGRKSDAAA
jgi:hypothetical protein